MPQEHLQARLSSDGCRATLAWLPRHIGYQAPSSNKADAGLAALAKEGPGYRWIQFAGLIVMLVGLAWVGVGVAGLKAIAQLLSIQALPFWSVALFAVDILALYGLIAYGGEAPVQLDHDSRGVAVYREGRLRASGQPWLPSPKDARRPVG